MESAFYTKDVGKTVLDLEKPVRGSGLILLVDDDKSIRITTKGLLEILGYSVITAEDGLEGVRIYEERYSEIDMVILDMIMPKMKGDEAFENMKVINPECKAVFISGFLKEEQLAHLFAEGIKGFMEKPLDVRALSQLVYEVKMNRI